MISLLLANPRPAQSQAASCTGAEEEARGFA
jgi:hypothetical protein